MPARWPNALGNLAIEREVETTMSNDGNDQTEKQVVSACWEFDAGRNMWTLKRVPPVHPANMTAGYFLTHVGGVLFPTVSLYVFAVAGLLVSLALRHHVLRLLVGAASIAAVPVIIRVMDGGAEHVARVDLANLGPVGVIVGCVAVAELARHAYPRCRFTLCLPAYVVPKAAPEPA